MSFVHSLFLSLYSLRVTMSIYPIPSICAQDQITDWFESLAECLHWNMRKRQKQLDEYSDLAHSSSSDTIDSIDSRNEHLDAWRRSAMFAKEYNSHIKRYAIALYSYATYVQLLFDIYLLLADPSDVFWARNKLEFRQISRWNFSGELH